MDRRTSVATHWEVHMTKRRYAKTELGPGHGLVVGAALGTILFALTGSVWWLGLVGIGLVAGAALGQLLDRTHS